MFPHSKLEKRESNNYLPVVYNEVEKTSTYRAYGDLQVNVDDSSDEEEVDSKIEDYAISEQWERFSREIYRNMIEELELEDKQQTKTAILHSFIINAAGTYLLYSPQITRAYYLDKSINLGNSKIAKRSEIWEGIRSIVRKAIKTTLQLIVYEYFKQVSGHIGENIESREIEAIVETIIRESEKDITTYSKLLSVTRDLYKPGGITLQMVRMNNELQLMLYNTADIANVKISDVAERSSKRNSVAELLTDSQEKLHRRRVRINSVIARNIVKRSKREIIDRGEFLLKIEKQLVELLRRNQANLISNIKERDTIDNNYDFQLYNYADMLVAIRLHNRSQKRTLRNIRQDVTFEHAIVPATGTWIFGNGLSTRGCEIIKRSTHRRVTLTLAYSVRSYEGIRYEIEDLKEYYLPKEITRNYWDVCIAICIRTTINGRGLHLLESSDVSKIAIGKIKDLIGRLALMMFGYEAARCPGTIVLHQMILDLIIEGRLAWQDILDGNTESAAKGGYLPMSMDNASNIFRNIYNKFYLHYMPYPYHYEGGTGVENVKHIGEFISREDEIVRMWLQNACKEEENEFSDFATTSSILSLISSKIETWWRSSLHFNFQ